MDEPRCIKKASTSIREPDTTPWLSILVPVYNVAPYLEDCLKSIGAQSLEGVEVLFLDDASTDNSLSQLQSLVSADAAQGFGIWAHEQNRGLSAARNALFSKSSGQFIWFLDSDDYLQPNSVSKLRAVLDEANVDTVIFDHSIVEEQSSPDKEILARKGYVHTLQNVEPGRHCCSNKLFSGLFGRRRMQAWSRVFSRSLWGKGQGFPEGRYYEDVYCIPRKYAYVASYYYLQDSLVSYRKRQGSIVRDTELKKLEELISGVAGVDAYWLKNGIPLTQTVRNQQSIYIAISYINAMKALKRESRVSRQSRAQLRETLESALGYSMSRLMLKMCLVGRPDISLRLLRY